jgi:hypothetical protein
MLPCWFYSGPPITLLCCDTLICTALLLQIQGWQRSQSLRNILQPCYFTAFPCRHLLCSWIVEPSSVYIYPSTALTYTHSCPLALALLSLPGFHLQPWVEQKQRWNFSSSPLLCLVFQASNFSRI